jgi:hypothetical protein
VSSVCAVCLGHGGMTLLLTRVVAVVASLFSRLRVVLSAATDCRPQLAKNSEHIIAYIVCIYSKVYDTVYMIYTIHCTVHYSTYSRYLVCTVCSFYSTYSMTPPNRIIRLVYFVPLTFRSVGVLCTILANPF